MEEVEVVIITCMIYKNIKVYLLWVDYDFFENSSGVIKTFQNEESAQEFCKNKYGMMTDVWEENFNDLNMHDYSLYLDKWNVIGDLAKTMKEDFIGNYDDYNPLYKKYVCACNLPALNTSGKTYVPSFDEDEKEQIVNLTKDMCRILEIVFSGKN